MIGFFGRYGYKSDFEACQGEKLLKTSCVCRGHRISQGVLNRTYLGPLTEKMKVQGGLEMGEDKKSYLHFFKETLIIKLVIFRPANKGAALLQVDQGKRRI